MKNTSKYLLLFVLLAVLIISILPTNISANSAEPPAVVIVVSNPPKDLSIVLLEKKNEYQPKANVQRKAWEGYYAFYSKDLENQDDYIFKVTTKKKSFEISIKQPLEKHHNVFTLDLDNETVIQGTSKLRAVSLVSLRVILTLLIEAIIFWMFGFREKKSWIIFLVINLITQGFLNIWLNGASTLLSSYLLLDLILAEIVVLTVEMIAFPLLISEHEKSHIFSYVIIANIVSLILGGFIISNLPV